MVQRELEIGPETVEKNWAVLDKTQQQTVELLLGIDQAHVFAEWPEAGIDDDKKKKLLDQVRFLDSHYPGGLKQYVDNGRKLLEASRAGLNPFEGFIPQVPQGERLQTGTREFAEAEELGLQQTFKTGFVLVAGGLGERLGFKGIKIALPSEITSGKSFLQLYIETILAYQARGREATGDDDLVLPLAIMTSGLTHSRTVQLLEKREYFGMLPEQITIVKQENVPALLDNDAHFALSPSDPYAIETKPHGHGDVHTLLHQNGVVSKWVASGIEWVLFFQDTNGVVFRSVPAALGVSAKHNFAVNSLTVPRKPGEAVGGICCLTKGDESLTINVEYNQLDPLLRATISPEGDVPDETGFSPYPGNINVLVFAAKPYMETLLKTNGAIPEFVNPKYADEKKSKFKQPTRLECMMQDYPKLLQPSDKVGFTQLERWISFSAVKNNVADAAQKYASTGFAESASSGEADIYAANCRLLGKALKIVGDELPMAEYAGVPTKVGPKVVLAPSFGVTQAEIDEKLKNAEITLTPTSTLILEGRRIVVKKLNLDGTLVVRALDDAEIILDGISVKNKGWNFRQVDLKTRDVDPVFAIRGYDLEKFEERVIECDQGRHTFSN